MTPRLCAALAVSLVLLVSAAVLAVELTHRQLRRTGSNDQVISQQVSIPVGDRLCQPGETLPDRTRSLRVLAGTGAPASGPRLELSIYARGSLVVYGHSKSGYASRELIYFPFLRSPDRQVAPVTVCFTNRGRNGAVLFGDGAGPGMPMASVPNFVNPPVRVALDWYPAGPTGWRPFLKRVAQRFSYVKAPFFGSWTLWFTLLLLVAASAAGLRAALREARG